MIALVLLLAASSLPEEVAKKPARPGQAFLIVSPRLALWSPVHSVPIYVHASIPKPTPDFFCPAVELRVYGEFSGTNGNYPMRKYVESDCPPWTEGGFRREKDEDGNEIIVDIPPTASAPWIWEMNSASQGWALGPGEWIVEVVLTQGTKRVHLRGQVSVKGGDEPRGGEW
jgi:hypothetical protein